MATIQVAMRCRPFTIQDALGVQLLQNSMDPPTAEVNLLNSQFVGDRARFAFSYAWWSAFNYKLKLTGNDMQIADDMVMMSQPAVYDAVGRRVKADLMNGDPVVLFAYGLSGSGKTFTVFGPDAPDSPDAWFKHSEPHKLWGILPNVAYELFQEKKDDWKISMKYFQNVVDIVRDLMSNNAEEKHYKQGMQKDPDGFVDITWCNSKVLHSWDDFRNAFMSANARKAISPTQFNHQSTRGHCIMTLELEKPMDDNPSRKQRGRLYVCDLAGTEPAGDIYYANYESKLDANGNKEYTCLGPHSDQSKTRELQDQGKKINLSLSEMAQFFMKMAEAVVKKTLKPGKTIPGCNSFFLCKYLKDTLLQAKTYLFCAIRPEVTYHKYTFATLGFAKNASVIKVTPKKATGDVSPAERKLMEELEALKASMEELRKENQELQGEARAEGAGEGGGFSAADLEAAVAEKVAQLQKMQEQSVQSQEQSDQQQREKYARYGIALAKLDGDTQLPHFTNLDIDRFRDGVFMFILSKPEMTFGPKGDFQPQSLSVVPNHCSVSVSGDGQVSVTAGKGPTFVNGKLVPKDQTQVMSAFDRLAVGGELLLLRLPGREPEGMEIPSSESAVEEYQEALVSTGGSSGTTGLEVAGEGGGKWGLSPAAEKRIDANIQMLHPKLGQAAQICKMVDPAAPLEFSLTLKAAELTVQGICDDVEIRVNVTNPATSQSIALSEKEFLTCFSLLNDELGHMRDAVTYGGEHTIATENRPAVRFFDHMIHLGTCVLFTDILQYNMDTDPEDTFAKIFNVAPGTEGQVDAGKLEVLWTPLADPEDDGSGTVLEIDEPSALLGKPWTYRLQIKEAVGLPSSVHEAYIEYNFFGERFVTEVQEYEKGTRSPDFSYSNVHYVSNVTQEFLDFLAKPLELKIFTTPWVFFPPNGISTNDPGVAERIRVPGVPVAAGPAAQPELSAAREQAKELKRQVTEVKANADGEVAELRQQLAREKLSKRLMLVKGVVRDVSHDAEVTRLNGKLSSRDATQAPAPVAATAAGAGAAQEELERLARERGELQQQLALAKEDASTKSREKQELQQQLAQAKEETLQLHAELQRIEAERAGAAGMPGVVPAPAPVEAPAALSPQKVTQLQKERDELQKQLDESQRELRDLKAQAEAYRRSGTTQSKSGACSLQ